MTQKTEAKCRESVAYTLHTVVGQCQANEGRASGKTNESAACTYALPHSFSIPVSCSTSEAPGLLKKSFRLSWSSLATSKSITM